MTTNEEAFRTAVFPSTDAPQAIPRSALPETPVLVVSHLTVGAEDPARPPLLTDLTLSIGAGEIMGLVGESGAGKSMAGAALSGLLPKGIVRRAGAVALGGRRLDGLTEREMRAVRGRGIGFVFQDPLTSLDPLMTIGAQLEETIRTLKGVAGAQARAHALRLLTEAGLPDPERLLTSYPHELSGGMRQRVVIALALAGDPQLIVADEPTTALDATLQAQITALLKRLARERGVAVLLITHDMGVVAATCDRAAVLYSGRLVEIGPAADVLTHPQHPYTKGLIGSIPRAASSKTSAAKHPTLWLEQIEGAMPDPGRRPSGCAFHPRCRAASAECCVAVPELLRIDDAGSVNPGAPHYAACLRAAANGRAVPGSMVSFHAGHEKPWGKLAEAREAALAEAPEILRVEGVSKRFGKPSILARAQAFFSGAKAAEAPKALDDVSITIRRGETVAVVGESGSGKSTLAKTVAGLITADAGAVRFAEPEGRKPRIAMIFQDPQSSLNPRMTAGEAVEEALRIYAPQLAGSARRERAAALLARVGLPASAYAKRPHEFSGGQRQRISIARALACEPDLLLCDEPTSALDVSVQAQVLNLMKTLQLERGMSFLFISHNLGVVRHMCDRVVVMKKGRIVEAGPRNEVFGNPKHLYTRTLLASEAVLEPDDPADSAEVEAETAGA